MRRAYRVVEGRLSLPPLVHIVGTNGKGSTGRFLAGGLREEGLLVGHYTSPHIFSFNERIWIDGREVDERRLEAAHRELMGLLPPPMAEELTYFEYTTLLAMVLFQEVEIAVIEAGLGGEFDATAVFPTTLTLITTIDRDHQEFLGESIEEIATTKLNAIQRRGIVGIQVHREVERIARSYPVTFLEGERVEEVAPLVREEGLPPLFADNLALALEAGRELGIPIDPRKALAYRLPGRMERRGNILIDVGHNPLSARALFPTLPSNLILIYNSYRDKEYGEILSILAPKVERVEILPVEDGRIAERKALERAIERVGLPYGEVGELDPHRNYLVYGGFRVVQEFFRRYGSSVL